MPEVLNLIGASWHSYILEPHPVGTVFEPIGAVYVLCRRKPRRWEVLCVGETRSLQESFNIEDYDASDLLQDATHIGVFLTRNEEDRGAIVSDLQSGLRPWFNERAANAENFPQFHIAAQ